MPTYKTGKGTGTRTVEARQLVSANDFDLATWAGAALFLRADRTPELRFYKRIDGEFSHVETAARYDWIVRDKKGNVKVVSPEGFRDKYRLAEDEEAAK